MELQGALLFVLKLVTVGILVELVAIRLTKRITNAYLTERYVTSKELIAKEISNAAKRP